MNLQARADKRSLELHKLISIRLTEDETLWSKPFENLKKWYRKNNSLHGALKEWEGILNKLPRKDIILLITSDSQEAQRLRSSSPFTGILSEEERSKIFDQFK